MQQESDDSVQTCKQSIIRNHKRSRSVKIREETLDYVLTIRGTNIHTQLDVMALGYPWLFGNTARNCHCLQILSMADIIRHEQIEHRKVPSVQGVTYLSAIK